jgi:hypothetical protein
LLDHLRRGLRNRSVSDVANLAMIFVVGVNVPVGDRVGGKQGHREDDRYCQQTFGYTFRHTKLDIRSQYILPLMLPDQQR